LHHQKQKDPEHYPHQPSHSHSTAPLPVFGHGRWLPLQPPPNAVPKPPRTHGVNGSIGIGIQWHPSNAYPAPHSSHPPIIFRVQSSLPNGSFTNATTTTTTTTDYVRHVTRVNFYDIDTSQVEFEPKDDEESNEATASNCDTEAITKEGELTHKILGLYILL